MSTITVPSSVQSWPRAAMAAVAALIVALAVTLTLALTVARHTTTRTVFQHLDQPLSCQIGHPC
jgi:hypothetical protein